jgi:hypothetical protein
MKTAKESVLVLKDFTTILSMRSEERAEILSQLREVYDGRLDRETGMGDVLHWEGRVGFLAGVTPVIDQHHAVMALLGERFVYLRLPDTDAELIGGAAFDENAETAMRAGLATAMREFVEETPIEDVPEASAELRAAIVLMARRTAWVRLARPPGLVRRQSDPPAAVARGPDPHRKSSSASSGEPPF